MVKAMVARIPLDRDRIADFCRRWKIRELSLFGSVLRDDFGPHSDVDVLVEFDADEQWTLLDVAQMNIELQDLFGRPVDLVERKAIRNPLRRHTIEAGREVVYGA
jgi:predicted nucleotidyltransferase